MTRWQKFTAFVFANSKPIAMIVLLLSVYGIKKFVPLGKDELELLEGVWMALGLGAVFMPNFKRSEPPQ